MAKHNDPISLWKALSKGRRDAVTRVLRAHLASIQYDMLDSPNEVDTSHFDIAAEALEELAEGE